MACTLPVLTYYSVNNTKAVVPKKQLLAYDNDEYIIYNKNEYYYIVIEENTVKDKKVEKIKKIKKKKEYKNVSKIYNMKKNCRKYGNIHQPGRTNCSQRYQRYQR
uniref:Uncharacterized protein n=1 Tax=viral metagenome TaxID=1070528 RepID=A0A6C0C7B2_9ZZZZ